MILVYYVFKKKAGLKKKLTSCEMHASTDKLPTRLWFGTPPDTRHRFAARTNL